MNKSDEEKINSLIHNIGLNNNLRDQEVREIIESQFRFTYDTIRHLDLTEKQIEETKTNFIYKYLGKLYIDNKTFKTKEEYGNKA
jgi:hypothetical protein